MCGRDWLKPFLRFHAPLEASSLREVEVNEFLTHLAVRENVAASAQNQALCALLFFYLPGVPVWFTERLKTRGPKRVV